MAKQQGKRNAVRPIQGGGQPSSMAVQSGSYEVGYRRPPMHTRFKPGQSGNPRGRPRGRGNMKSIVKRVMNERVAVRQGETTRAVPMGQAILLAQATKAVKGDGPAAKTMLDHWAAADRQDETSAEEAEYDRLPDSVSPSPAKPRRSETLFTGIDAALLSEDELIELSRLAHVIDLGGDFTALKTGEFERVKIIVNKGRGKDVTPAV
jgi:Family of unknown function (DUF5681)